MRIVHSVSEISVCSWALFLSYWKNNFKTLVIRKPSKDICDECHTHTHYFKYLTSKRQRDDGEEYFNEDENKEEGDDEDDEDDAASDAVQAAVTTTKRIKDNEQLFEDATKHVKPRRTQEQL